MGWNYSMDDFAEPRTSVRSWRWKCQDLESTSGEAYWRGSVVNRTGRGTLYGSGIYVKKQSRIAMVLAKNWHVGPN